MSEWFIQIGYVHVQINTVEGLQFGLYVLLELHRIEMG